METSAQPRAWKVLLAFVIIYFVWGATFLAIRVGGARGSAISFGGNALPGCGNRALWLDARPGHTLSEREWGAASFLAVLIFVFDYGLLFWAERRVPSGIAAVMMATIPVFMALAEIVFLRTQRLTLRLGVALLLG